MSHHFYALTHLRGWGNNIEIFSFIFWFKLKLQNLLSKLTDLYLDTTESSRLMQISLLRISLLRFFKTFQIYLANAILFIFC